MSELSVQNPPSFRLTSAILVTILLEAVAGLLWVGAAAQRLSAIEQRLDATTPVAERLARLEAEMSAARNSLARIETQLDQKASAR